MTHTPSDADPGIYVLRIGLTPADSFPFPKLKLLPALPDYSMTHKQTDTSTQQFSNSHFLSCSSTLMQFQKKFLIFIHRICTSSTAQAILAINSSQKKKRVRSFPHVLSSLSLIPLVYLCNRSSTLPHTQRKILSIAKLFSTELLLLSTLLSSSPLQKLSVLRNPSFRSFSSTIVSFVQKLQPFSRAKPPFSIIASSTLAIIRSRHTGSIPFQCSRHANLSVHLPSPKSTKLPMRK